ncbi:non-ribosomal peptide synthetase [Bacillus wiedmannii]|uniref:non-ribosomal peptide synthetase n=1 Tax=Bacillus wiedmannii TaxID=1890302 RepID=UPI0020D27C1C|nr:non-ribosomal peptide synthetase [Bacillus wiedmannii]
MFKDDFYKLSQDKKRKFLQNIQNLLQQNQFDEAKKYLHNQSVSTLIDDKHEPFPLSDIQESFSVGKFIGRGIDNVGCHAYFEIQEYNLDVKLLKETWNQLLQYHEMLQVVVLPNRTQQVLQHVPEYDFKVYDVRGKNTKDITKHFNEVRDKMSHKVYRENEWPLFEICITKMDNNEYIIHFSIDEWIVDGFSISLLFKQWYNLYKNPKVELDKINFSFREYVKAKKEDEDSWRFKRDLSYWMEKYSDIPAGPNLPWKVPSKKIGEKDYFFRKRYQHVIKKEDWDKLKEASQFLGISQTVMLITCFSELLSYWSESEKYSIIFTYFNRVPIHEDIDKVVGPFVSTNIFTIDNPDTLTIKEKVKNYQQTIWDDLDHSSVSGIKALREIRLRDKKAPNLSIPIVFTSMLNNAGKEAEGSWLEKIVYSISQTPQVCLDHQVYEQDGNLIICWDVVEEYFEANIIQEIFSSYIQVIQNLARDNQLLDITSLKEVIDSNRRYSEGKFKKLSSPSNSAKQNEKFVISDMQQSNVYARSKNNKGCRAYQEFEMHNLDIQKLQKALNSLIKCHDMLRATMDNRGFQHVLGETSEYIIPINDLRGKEIGEELNQELERIRHSLINLLFPLGQWPLFNVSVSLMSQNKARVHVTIDALIADGKSISTFYNQLFDLYTNPQKELEEPKISFRDYINFIKEYKQTGKGREEKIYWENKFLNLPSGPTLPYKDNTNLKPVHKRLEGSLTNWERVKQVAKTLDISPDTILFTVYAEVLSRWSKEKMFTTIYVDWSRIPIHPEINNVIGDFTSLSWVINQNLECTFVEKAKYYQKMIKDDQTCISSGLQEFRNNILRSTKENPLSFPVVFTNSINVDDLGDGSNIENVYGLSITPGICLDNMSCEQGDVLRLQWDFDSSVLPEYIVRDMFKNYQSILEHLFNNTNQWGTICLNNIDNSYASPSSLSTNNQLLLQTVEEMTDNQLKCIHTLFEEKVQKTPRAIALSLGEQSMTYQELNNKANQLAHYLKKFNSGPETLVGICIDRSLDMIVGILGILKSGAAYVPLDPHNPKERLSLIIEDAKIPILVTKEKFNSSLSCPDNCQIINLDKDQQKISLESNQNPEVFVIPDNIAYVIYTSGSTGKPKGALISHRNVTRLFKSTENWFNFNEKDVWMLYHSFAFDFSVWEIWGALLHGGRLVIIPYVTSRTFQEFYQLVLQEKVTVLNQTPTAFKQFLLADNSMGNDKLSLRYIIFGGEALNPEILRPWFEKYGDKKPQLVNMYGITETTVHVTYRPLSLQDVNSKTSVIGKPIPDLQLYILNDKQEIVPTGSPGELYVGGKGVARGYLNRPELTEERFIENPFSNNKKEKLYKTGDLVMELSTDEIAYLGRIDTQVKIRGFRIELGEIENQLIKHELIDDVAVMVKDQETDNPKIIAYIIASNKEDISIKSLRQFMRNKVPDYMIPNIIVRVTEFKITENGKLDRSALTKYEEKSVDYEINEQITIEDIGVNLVSIFTEIIQSEETITKLDNIFDLGITSLTMMTTIQKVEEKFKIKIPMEMLFEGPSINGIAIYIYNQMKLSSAVLTTQEEIVEKLSTISVNDTQNEGILMGNPVRESVLQEVIKMLRDVLKVDDTITKEDNLFDLGVTSLTLMTLVQKIEEKYKFSIPMEMLFTLPTIEEIVAFIDSKFNEDIEIIEEKKNQFNRYEEELNPKVIIDLEAVKLEEQPDNQIAHKIYFKDQKITFDTFSKFLSLLQMKQLNGGEKYLYPSAGGRNPIQTYVYVKEGRIEGLTEGIYYYHPLEHCLYTIEKDVKIDNLAHFEFNRDAFNQGAFMVFFIAQLDALKPIYVDYSPALAKVETGYMIQLLMNRQSESNISLHQAIGFDFERVESFFKLDKGHQFIHALIGGYCNETSVDLFNGEHLVNYLTSNKCNLTDHFIIEPKYSDVLEMANIQKNKKFNPLSQLEADELTQKQVHIRKFTKDVEKMYLQSNDFHDSEYILRSSQRDYMNAPVPIEDFSRFLLLLKKEKIGGFNKCIYSIPAGISGISIYIYVKKDGVSGLEEGIYKYHAKNNQLIKVKNKLSVSIRMCHSPYNMFISEKAKFFIFLLADLVNSKNILSKSCLDYANIEAGTIGQVLMDNQAKYNIGMVPIGGMDFEKIHRDFNVEENNIYIHSFMCGSVSYKDKETPIDLSEELIITKQENNNDNQKLINNNEVIEIDEKSYYPLSYGQKSLFYIYQANPSSSSYNTAYHVRIKSKLNIQALKSALRFLVKKQPLLRSTFTIKGDEAVQVVHENYDSNIEVINASNWSHEKLVNENLKAYRQPFNLIANPAFRVILFEISDSEYVMLFNIHHIITDFMSTGLLVKDLWGFYEELLNNSNYLPDIDPDFRYFEYISWQNDFLQSNKSSQMWSYWKKTLSGDLPVLNLPTDKPRPIVQTFNGSTVKFVIEKELTEAFRAFSKSSRKTLYTVMLTAFKTLLYRYTGQTDILVGTTATARGEERFKDAFGYFINPIVVRSNLSEESTFKTLLERVSKSVYSALSAQNYPFPLLVEKLNPIREANRSPIFQVTFQLINQNMTFDQEKGHSFLEPFEIPQQEGQFDLDVEIIEETECMQGRIVYNTDLFESSTIERLKEHFLNLLKQIILDPDKKIISYDILSDKEKQLLIEEWNHSKVNYSGPQCIHHLFEQESTKHPNSIAVSAVGRDDIIETITYTELNQKANQLANYLRSINKEKGIVGICLNKSIDVVVSILATFKAGYAYVPIDSSFPHQRQKFIISDSDAKIIITSSELELNFEKDTPKIINIDQVSSVLESYDNENIKVKVKANDLAYIIYTSGSTGNPKGVKISHGSAVNIFNGYKDKYLLEDVCKIHLQMASISFDVFIGDLMRSLCSGGKLVLCPREYLLNPKELYEYIVTQNIHIAEFVPAVMRKLVQYMRESNKKIDNMKTVIISSDSWNVKEYYEFRRYFSEDTSFINAYGITEVTIDSTYLDCSTLNEDSQGFVPIGDPFPNTQIYVLDQELNPTPIGVPGELCIGGEGVAIGYLNRPELTQEKFVPNPFDKKMGERIYRTGDLARYLKDGTIEFLGRLDYQIKIRGLRVEIGEVEEVLMQYPLIKEAVVLAKKDESGENILVGYYMRSMTKEISIEELQTFMKRKLPDYMIPTIFIEVKELPLSPNGKVDRKLLPEPSFSIINNTWSIVEPSNDIQRKLVEIWKKVLQIDRVGIENDFFSVGGHSFLVMKLIAAVERELNVEVKLTKFLENPTVKQLEKIISNNSEINELIYKLKEENINLKDEVINSDEIIPVWKNPHKVLLTGATGHLGVNLLIELLKTYKSTYVYCLVRAESQEAAKTKIENAIKKYKLWESNIMSRIVPLVGDLELPLLGQDTEAFNNLAQEIDVIFHNGAFVNFAYPYSVLKKANVLGTVEILKLAIKSKVKPVHYVSTTSVFDNIRNEIGISRVDNVINDDTQLIHNKALETMLGYTQSKWVAEKIIQNARSQGIPITIYRPDIITGDSKTGFWNLTDMAGKNLRNIVESGIIPDKKIKFNWMPVDYVGKTIIYLSTLSNSLNKNYNLSSPFDFNVQELGEMLRELGYPVKELPFEEWKKEMICLGEQSSEMEIPKEIFEEIQDYNSKKVLVYDLENVTEDLKNTNLECPVINKNIVEKYISYFKDCGSLR